LFVVGPSRSGTTALTDYMNEHEQVLICMERYKYVPESVTPEAFTYQRILNYKPKQGSGETNIPRERQEAILAGKDPAKLRWIGDKGPAAAKRFEGLSENNPGAHFLITYRPIEEVVESFEDRARNLEDPWIGGKDGLKMGVQAWNRAMRSTREYLESHDEPNGLIVSYHDFFSDPRVYVPMLSEFLELDFDDATIQKWVDISGKFESRRREKEPATEAKTRYIEQNKDHDAEEWVLGRIARQWSDPRSYKQTVGQEAARQRLAAVLTSQRRQEKIEVGKIRQAERRIEKLREELATERKRSELAEKKHRSLEERMKEIRSSRSWELLTGIGHIRSAVRRSARR
jgi:hypothetical protein